MDAEIRFGAPNGALFLEGFQKARIISLEAYETSLDLMVAMTVLELKAQRCGHPTLLKSA